MHELTVELCSGPVRECTEYHSRTKNAGAFEPPIPLQSEIQLSGHGIHVRLNIPSSRPMADLPEVTLSSI